MINTLNQSTALPRLNKSKFLSILAVSALVLTVTFSRADSDGNQSDRGLAGTWISVEGGGSLIQSFMGDGRVIGSIPINILTGNGPGGEAELAAPEHGEWIRTSNREFATTTFSQLSHPSVGFTHLIKLTGNYRLDKTSDALTLTNPMISVYLPDGTLQFGPFPGAVTHFKRIIAGQ